MCPPVVSVAGFTNVDRGMFRAVSNLTKELECCNKQVRSVLFRNGVKDNLQISGGGLVSVRLDRLVYCTGTFTHISVGVFLLMDGQKLEYWRLQEFYCKELRKSPPFVPRQYSVMSYLLQQKLKIIKTINLLPFCTKRKIL